MSVTAYPTLRLKLTQPQTLQMRFLPALPGFNASQAAHKVSGPAGGVSTDNAIARWDGVTGRLIQNSGVLIDDSNNMTLPASWMQLAEIASPTNPPADSIKLFAKDVGGVTHTFARDSTGVETDLHTGTSTAASFNIEIVIEGAAATITPGVKGDYEASFDYAIEQVKMLADQVGSIVVDIWKDTYANYPPTDADSITGAAPPTISADDQSVDSTLTGWTTSVAAGDTLRFNVDSATSIRRVTLSLKCVRT